jgi:hypothetical protein
MTRAGQTRALATLLTLSCLAASPPPVPRLKHRHAQGVTQGAGALALIKRTAVLQPRVVTIDWQYPPGLEPANFFWNVEGSTDLKMWSVIITNASGVNTVTVNRNEPLRVFRLSGRLSP